MTNNVLSRIIDNKRAEVKERKKLKPLDSFKNELTKSNRSLFNSLSSEHSDFIFECKKASPSKGLLRENFNLDDILPSYKRYASAISVLTDFTFFQGSFEYLEKVARTVSQPVLCKDFFIECYQVYEARYQQADAILLMLSVLNDSEYKKLAKVAAEFDLDVLTEVHDETEMQRAIALDAKIIGVNNRNLKDLSIDLATTEILIESLAHEDKLGKIFISESGISSHADVKRLSSMVSGFLVGSSLMEKDDLSQQCKSLIYGNIKICGLGDNEAALHAEKMGASYGGLIFHPKSPRYVSKEKAKEVISGVPMDFVGVFVDEPIDSLVAIANELNLAVIQLHGQESIEYVADLKNRLPKIQIWKAISAKNNDYITQQVDRFLPFVDKILVDTHSAKKRGGVGKPFDWDVISNLPQDKIIIAGGLNQSNILQAQKLNTFALDVNSGVEHRPGVKNISLITSLFEILKP